MIVFNMSFNFEESDQIAKEIWFAGTSKYIGPVPCNNCLMHYYPQV